MQNTCNVYNMYVCVYVCTYVCLYLCIYGSLYTKPLSLYVKYIKFVGHIITFISSECTGYLDLLTQVMICTRSQEQEEVDVCLENHSSEIK